MIKHPARLTSQLAILLFAASTSIAYAFFGGYAWSPVVDTSRGTLIGYNHGDIREFLGVPYAEPPTGDRRWQRPEPKRRWWLPREALTDSPSCLQGELISNTLVTSEDCLYLNIWTPNTPGPHPVMVWIHGGNFTIGEGGSHSYDGAKLAREHDVVVVTINYRLSFLGFLSLPGLSARSGYGASGNQGFYDQIEALRFVKREIGAFGGDANNITLFGESAGSISTCILMSSPLTDGLINKAIMQSGGCGIRPAVTLAEAEADGLRFAREVLGCDGPDPAGCALSMSTVELRARMVPFLLDDIPLYPLPVIDGHFLAKDSLEHLADGNTSHIPVLLGHNENEGSVFVLDRDHADDEAGYRADTAEWYPERDIDDIMALYPLSNFGNAGDADAHMYGDRRYICTIKEAADILSDTGSTVYRYHFSQDVFSPYAGAIALISFGENPPELGTVHTAEIPYIFGNASILGALGTWEKQKLSNRMMRYWTNFARTGNPNDGRLPHWPRYDSSSQRFQRLDSPISTGSHFKTAECALWLSD